MGTRDSVRRRRWSRRTPGRWALVRYALVGVANAATYYVVYLLVLHQVGYLTAHVLGLGAAMVVSFFLNCRVTFRVRPSWRRFLLYPASQVVNVAATTVGVVGLVGVGVDVRLAPLVAAVLPGPGSLLPPRLAAAPPPPRRARSGRRRRSHPPRGRPGDAPRDRTARDRGPGRRRGDRGRS